MILPTILTDSFSWDMQIDASTTGRFTIAFSFVGDKWASGSWSEGYASSQPYRLFEELL